jgi:hypothetical protein
MVHPQNMSLGAPFGVPEARAAGCRATRTVPAGGAFVSQLLHDEFTPFQQIYRALPQAGLLTASRQRPIQFTLGAFTVPKGQVLALGEYRFRPYRFEGLIPGDAVPVEDYRLSLEIGNDVLVSSRSRPGNIRMQIIPAIPPVVNTPDTQGVVNAGVVFPPLNVQNFDNVGLAYPAIELSNFSNQIATDGTNPRQYVTTLSGASLIPQRPEGQQGPDKLPFTYFVDEVQTAVLTTAIFAPVRMPIAFFEGEISGYLMPINTLRALMNEVKPCT